MIKCCSIMIEVCVKVCGKYVYGDSLSMYLFEIHMKHVLKYFKYLGHSF